MAGLYVIDILVRGVIATTMIAKIIFSSCRISINAYWGNMPDEHTLLWYTEIDIFEPIKLG